MRFWTRFLEHEFSDPKHSICPSQVVTMRNPQCLVPNHAWCSLYRQQRHKRLSEQCTSPGSEPQTCNVAAQCANHWATEGRIIITTSSILTLLSDANVNKTKPFTFYNKMSKLLFNERLWKIALVCRGTIFWNFDMHFKG